MVDVEKHFVQDPNLQALFLPLLMMIAVIYICKRSSSNFEISQQFMEEIHGAYYDVSVRGVFAVIFLQIIFTRKYFRFLPSFKTSVYIVGIIYAFMLYLFVIMSTASISNILDLLRLDRDLLELIGLSRISEREKYMLMVYFDQVTNIFVLRNVLICSEKSLSFVERHYLL